MKRFPSHPMIAAHGQLIGCASTIPRLSAALTDEALQEYQRCFCTPEAIHASCEDYRAAADIDLEMDEEEK